MSPTVDTFEKGEKLRARIVVDEDPMMPYDDGGSPILTMTYLQAWGHWKAEQVEEITSYRVHPRIIEAAAEMGEEPDKFERYLRIFWGVRQVEWVSAGDFTYVSFDPAEWRADMGLTDEFLAERPDVRTTDMTEWKHYLNGEVYGVIVEEIVHYIEDGGTRTLDEWTEVESCWGYYGYESAVKAASEALEDWVANSTPEA